MGMLGGNTNINDVDNSNIEAAGRDIIKTINNITYQIFAGIDTNFLIICATVGALALTVWWMFIKNKQETIIDHEKLIVQLQEKLITSTEAAVAQSNLPVALDRPINEVELELTTDRNAQMLDDVGHFHRRKDFMKLHKTPKGNISLNKIFEHAEVNAREEADRIYRRETEKKQHIKKHGNIVAMKGQCGIGKTTITKLLAREILMKSLFCITFIFYIPIRAINFATKCNLLQFLLQGCSCAWEHSLETDKILLKELEGNPNVILILDGLDESDMDASTRAPAVTLYQVSSPEYFIKNILSGNVLPNAKKLITSRPRQLYDLYKDHRPHFVVAVLGLGKNSQGKLCKAICGSYAGKVAEYLDGHPNISAYCYVPVNCILTNHCIYESMKKGDEVNLGSITSILVYSLNGFIRSDNMRGSFELEKLAKLAWSGFKDHKIIFEETDLDNAGIGNITSGTFLQTVTNTDIKLKIMEFDKKSYFSHLIWQEFFSAIRLMFVTPLEEFKEQASNFDKSRWEIVTRFLFGLCNRENADWFQKVLKRDIVDVKAKTEILERFLCHSVHGFQPTTDDVNKAQSSNESQTKLTKFKKFKSFVSRTFSKKRHIPPVPVNQTHQQEILRICEWAFEANIESMRNRLVGGLPDEIKLETKILPSDVIGLNYLLRARQTPLVIKVSKPTFVGDSFDRFFMQLHLTMESNANIQLGSRVDIRGSQLTDEGLEFLGQCMQHSEKSNQQTSLILQRCEITTRGYQIISSAIKQLHYPMEELDLNGISIGDDEANSISCCLHNIEKLYLYECGITSTGVKYITSSICNLQKPMEELFLSDNSIGDDGANSISCCLHNIERLYLLGCGITSTGVKYITSSICNLQKPMEQLVLSDISIGDDGANSISCCLHNIERLLLHKCDITSTGVKYITSSICNLQKPMEYLDISRNDIGDDAIDFVTCLHNIKELMMWNRNISQSVKDAIEEAARRAGTEVTI